MFCSGLTACGEPLPPLHLVDAEAHCGHLRQDAPDVYLSCISAVVFANEMRIESRQRYLQQQMEDWTPAPLRAAPVQYDPPPAASMPMPNLAPPVSLAPTPNIAPYDYIPHPPPTVLCVGQIPVPGGSNAEGMRLGCQ